MTIPTAIRVAMSSVPKRLGLIFFSCKGERVAHSYPVEQGPALLLLAGQVTTEPSSVCTKLCVFASLTFLWLRFSRAMCSKQVLSGAAIKTASTNLEIITRVELLEPRGSPPQPELMISLLGGWTSIPPHCIRTGSERCWGQSWRGSNAPGCQKSAYRL